MDIYRQLILNQLIPSWLCRHGWDHIVIGFTSTYVWLSWSGCWLNLYLGNKYLWTIKLGIWFTLMVRCARYNIVMKFICYLQWVIGFIWVLLDSSANKTDCRDITEMLLTVASIGHNFIRRWVIQGVGKWAPCLKTIMLYNVLIEE